MGRALGKLLGRIFGGGDFCHPPSIEAAYGYGFHITTASQAEAIVFTSDIVGRPHILDYAGIAGIFVIGVLAVFLKSYYNGYIRDTINAHQREARDSKDKLDEIRDLTEDTYNATTVNNKQIHDIAEAVVVLHHDDERVNADNLRDQVGIERVAFDLFNGRVIRSRKAGRDDTDTDTDRDKGK